MANVTSAAFPLNQSAHGYAGPSPGVLFPQSLPPQFPQVPHYPHQHPSAPPEQIYHNFQQQHAAYGNPQAQLSTPITAPTPPPPTYTSAPYSQPASASSTSHSNPQSGPTPLPRPASQPAHNMAAPPGPFIPNAMMQQRQPGPNGALSQQSQLQNAVQGQQGQTHPPQPANQLPPHLAARERARVSVLLEINTHLLQEVVSLQAQGKAGMPPQPQQSPVKESAGSPTSVTDPANQLNNSPVDPPKPAGGKPPSPEYVDCMRRLQANLAYLAAIADAKKKASGTLPVGPAITAPPAHLAEVAELYKKLNMLFPSASQTAVSRAMAIAGAQTPKPQNSVQAHG